MVSTALTEAKRIIEERYSPSEWNIYMAQASDGENFSGDSEKCVALLNEDLMRCCQYFAYVEIVDEAEAEFLNSEENGIELWRNYRRVGARMAEFRHEAHCQTGRYLSGVPRAFCQEIRRRRRWLAPGLER